MRGMCPRYSPGTEVPGPLPLSRFQERKTNARRERERGRAGMRVGRSGKSLNDLFHPHHVCWFYLGIFFFFSVNIITRQCVFSFLSGEMKDVCNRRQNDEVSFFIPPSPFFLSTRNTAREQPNPDVTEVPAAPHSPPAPSVLPGPGWDSWDWQPGNQLRHPQGDLRTRHHRDTGSLHPSGQTSHVRAPPPMVRPKHVAWHH